MIVYDGFSWSEDALDPDMTSFPHKSVYQNLLFGGKYAYTCPLMYTLFLFLNHAPMASTLLWFGAMSHDIHGTSNKNILARDPL